MKIANYQLPIKVLFEILEIDDVELDTEIPTSSDVYIKTESGYSHVNHFVKKRHTCKEFFLEDDISIRCSTKHIVFSGGDDVHIDLTDNLDTVTGNKKILSKTDLGVMDVYDVSIAYPHRYVTPNGIIHHNTTAALALCKDLGYDVLMINGSLEGRLLETLRGKITDFASGISFDGKRRAVLLDECDYVLADPQAALRNMIEQFSSNCTFILTANFPNRIIEPLHSRCSGIDFTIPSNERKDLLMGVAKRVFSILQKENITFDKTIVVNVIKQYFPDFRRVLNELQAMSGSGTIDEHTASIASNSDIENLVEIMKSGNWNDMRKWVAMSPNVDLVVLCRKLFDGSPKIFKSDAVPQFVLLCSQYQYKASFVQDKEIHTVAFLTDVMVNCEFV